MFLKHIYYVIVPIPGPLSLSLELLKSCKVICLETEGKQMESVIFSVIGEQERREASRPQREAGK